MVNDIAPGSIERRGIGPLSAAPTIVSFSHPGRRRNDAAFAAPPAPAPCPSAAAAPRATGSTEAVTAPRTRPRTPSPPHGRPTTQAYVARRTAQGKNHREIRRCIKRYTARQELLRWRDSGRLPNDSLRILRREPGHEERTLPDR
jgi:transposase